RRHVPIQEADAVRDLAVAEDRGATTWDAIRPIEQLGLEEPADLVALELDADRPREHALVRRAPIEAGLEHLPRRPGRDRALRPRSARPRACSADPSRAAP